MIALPYLVTRKRLRDSRAAVRIATIAEFARKLDAAADLVPSCRHSRGGERDSCSGCLVRRTWAEAVAS